MSSKSPSVKFLVTYHKPAPLLTGSMFVPINGGRANLISNYTDNKVSEYDYQWLLDNTIGDDTGENISKENSRYNEMTVIYWAWKNYEKLGNPEYIGLMHYRRHFMFKDWSLPQNDRWTYDYPFFSRQYVDDLNLKPEAIQDYLKQYDCLYAYHYLRFTVAEQYKMSHFCHSNELDFVLATIKKDYPDIYPSAQKYINGNSHYFCNMFVMRRGIFKQYCEFVFDILSKFDKNRDISDYSIEEMRFFISERVTGIFIQYLIDIGNKCCPLNISFLENTNIKQDIKPAFQSNNIPVVFSVDDKYVPYLATTLSSLLKNSKNTNNYDLFVLYNKLSDVSKEKLLSLLYGYSNVSLRFIDVTPYLADIDVNQFPLRVQHISIATYYRFFIADIFSQYKKVIYLDSDLVVNSDIANLYGYDINNNWLGVVIDIREAIQVKIDSCEYGMSWREYTSKVLKLEEPYKYFQAGVLVFNTEQFIKNNVKDKLFKKMKEISEPYLQDQDILNAVCHKHVTFLPISWNIEWQIPFEHPNYRSILPYNLYKAYSDAIRQKNIIHYASPVKPWNYPENYLAEYWWKYTRLTPFYEEILKKMTDNSAEKSIVSHLEKIPQTRFIEQIFSLKNSNNKKHKVLTLLGIQLKIRR